MAREIEMELVQELKIELSAQDAEKIITEYIENQMEQNGYKLEYSRNEDGPFPDTFWRGKKIDDCKIIN
jgi:ABC-type metal ion transport system substrate-binding protein